ncbi:hypothetical protein AVEN_50101-1 [Araneus ventricosus]|uniref:Endonuclease/exonuclease/phosphatase domain-containing protein n=1 Tax=Araneus ventricosus TaxID=182803 RepID=A0A4Y2FQ62_ARAVE|nr:hypothetical protein AVEN_50101-1 [Araneus ventricosus]
MREIHDFNRGAYAPHYDTLMGLCPSCFYASTWNANGLLGKVDDLREFDTRIKPDILLMQETRLRAADRITVSNYTLYSPPSRTHRRSRGTAILMKSTINHQYLPNPTLRYIEATMVIVNLPNIPPINFVSAYRPPDKANVIFTLDFESIYAYNTATFIVGDLNAKHRNWNCSRNGKFGRQLANFAGKTNAKIVELDTPTHFHYRGSSVIDLGLARNIPYGINSYSLTDLPSDHLLVKFLIDTGTPAEIPRKFIFQLEKI